MLAVLTRLLFALSLHVTCAATAATGAHALGLASLGASHVVESAAAADGVATSTQQLDPSALVAEAVELIEASDSEEETEGRNAARKATPGDHHVDILGVGTWRRPPRVVCTPRRFRLVDARSCRGPPIA